MAKLVSVFISTTHRRVMSLLVWALSFAIVLAFAGWYSLHKASDAMEAEAQLAAGHFMRLRENLLSTIDVMHKDLTADPCTPAFKAQLRRVAYLPDGLNEFLYAPGGVAQCSTNIQKFALPVDLGTPDISPQGERGMTFWMDYPLDFVGMPGEFGSIALSEPFAAVIPAQQVNSSTAHWLSFEAVVILRDGTWWHRSGESGIYARLLDPAASGLLAGKKRSLSCDPQGLHCIAVEADLPALMASRPGLMAMVLLGAGLVGWGVNNRANGLMTRYWSLEERLRRHLDAASIVCAYQPLMALDTGEITGCEVLARWRDIDDRIVFPDNFIGILERNDMTLRFTEMVARRAYEELSEQLPAGKRLQVNFNIFPRDLNSAKLARIYAGFLSQPARFDIILEIIESDEIPANAQREIEALRKLGIKTYIDDFGSGYSNMQSLAALSVDGVKLDRAFAMAPDDSMMSQMLLHAVEMIHATGRVMVVEGVETAERLALLQKMQARIDFVQGYFISRPLDIAAFVGFMKQEAPVPAECGETAEPGTAAA